MKHFIKQFPEKILQAIEVALANEKKTNPHPIAAFDADGTLWKNDMGEGLFRYQVQKDYVKIHLSRIADPWEHYRDWKRRGDTGPALMWLAQINAGFSLEQVRAWAEEYVRSITPMPVFPEQAHLIDWLLQKGVRVYVVTASSKWSVEPAAARLGIPFENVLGLKTVVKEGIVTDVPDGFLTFNEGKEQGLLAATKGVRPFFSTGNSMGDEFLLKCSSGVRLAIRSHSEDHELFDTEERLHLLAQKNGWLSHRF